MKNDLNGKKFYSFEEFGVAYGLSPRNRQTKDKQKLASQREKFVGKCRVCGQLMTWIEGTNIVACKNPDCKGYKYDTVNEKTGETKVSYAPVYRILAGENSREIAEVLFK